MALIVHKLQLHFSYLVCKLVRFWAFLILQTVPSYNGWRPKWESKYLELWLNCFCVVWLSKKIITDLPSNSHRNTVLSSSSYGSFVRSTIWNWFNLIPMKTCLQAWNNHIQPFIVVCVFVGAMGKGVNHKKGTVVNRHSLQVKKNSQRWSPYLTLISRMTSYKYMTL